jgi:hypothetical protein
MNRDLRLWALDRQVQRLRLRRESLQRLSLHCSWIRFAVFSLGLLAAVVVYLFVDAWLAGVCLLAAALLFGIVVRAHRNVNLSLRHHRLWLRVKSGHVARARIEWEQLPSGFHHQPDPQHPFEHDLDLIGRRSLHRLIDTAVTYEGSLRLRHWLTAQVPDWEQALSRQRLVRELAPLHLFRDKLAVNAALAAGANKTWKANELVAWLERREPETLLRRWLFLFAALVVVNLALFVANRLGFLQAWWQLTVVLYLGLLLVRSRASEGFWEEAKAMEGAMRQLYAVFEQLETYSYQRRPHLRALCNPFLDAGRRPSKHLSRVTRVLAGMGLQANPLLRLALNIVVPWDAALAYLLSQIKAQMATHAPTWMDTWFELEALCSLANLAYLNPGYSFPEITALWVGEPTPVFHTEGLGHPLIQDAERVSNDLTIGTLGQVTLITGSNMAGKSVFLKTVGTNLSLAYAGGPVAARCLKTIPFRMFTSMAISDSVTDGISYFYAEVKRLQALLAELDRDHPMPLLYCIDEIFRGTNNRERLLGSQAYVSALAGKRGLGFIATHDLELAKLADESPQVVNYHFRDHIEAGRMVFDFQLRPGPSPTTNALTIMALEGLPTPPG